MGNPARWLLHSVRLLAVLAAFGVVGGGALPTIIAAPCEPAAVEIADGLDDGHCPEDAPGSAHAPLLRPESRCAHHPVPRPIAAGRVCQRYCRFLI